MEEDDFDSSWQPTEVLVGDKVQDFAGFFGGSFLRHRLSGKQGGRAAGALTGGERVPPAQAEPPAFPLVSGHTWHAAEPRSVGESLTPVVGSLRSPL